MWRTLPWKTIILVAGFVVLVAGIGLALYFLFYQPLFTPPATEPIKPEGPTGQLPIAGQGKTPIAGNETSTGNLATNNALITKTPTQPNQKPSDIAAGGLTKVTDILYGQTPSTSLDATGNGLMAYDAQTGKFYRLKTDGTKEDLTDKIFKDVKNITWAPKAEKAILEFPDGSNILYNFKNKQQITIPKNWTEFSFSADENQIAFKDLDPNPERQFLSIANADGSNQKYLEVLGTKVNQVKVGISPNNQFVATLAEAGAGDFNKLYFIGQNQENFRALDLNGTNAVLRYAPDGSHLVYSSQNAANDHKPSLNIVEAAGDRIGFNHQSLGLNTWADKCTFAGTTEMYCAVPKEMPSGAGWYRELADNVSDYIYKINLATGAKSFIANPEYNYNIENMQVSSDGTTLFFTDKATKTLHKIQLK
jgi:Tol biopolymer transport system component